MKIWIGCLASYNNGRLIGDWFDVSTDEDENAANIANVLKASPIKGAEEFYIADYEDAPDPLPRILGVNPTGAALADAATLMEKLEARWSDYDEQKAVLGVMLDCASASDLATLGEDFDDWVSDHFAGEGDTLKDWCEEFLDDTGFFSDIPKGDDRLATIARYFDYESYARDLQLGGDISCERANGKVLVFWNR